MTRPIPLLPLLAALACGMIAAGCSDSAARAAAQTARSADSAGTGGPAWNAPSADPDRIVLTWSGDPATTQSVTWRTDTTVARGVAEVALATPEPGFVGEATAVDAVTETLDARAVEMAETVARFHSATFTGLTPDTVYAYRVGDGERWSEWFHFRTASTEAEPFSFIYFGDAQNDVLSLWSRVIREGYATAPRARFMIHAGDLVNRAHADLEWGEWFRAGGFIHAMVPSVPAAGNHEYHGYTEVEDEADVEHLSVFWQPQFALPQEGAEGVPAETSYYLDYQGVRVVVLNSSEDLEAQAAWLDRVLADNPATWTVVTHHHPVWSASEGRDNEELRAAWKPVYDRHGVDLVLQGHDHSYARGRTYAGAENVPTGANVRDGDTGTVYVVSVSGRKMYDLKPDGWRGYGTEMERQAENVQLFQVLHVDGEELRYRAYTATGGLYDAFTLRKRPGRANLMVSEVPEGAVTFDYDNTLPYLW
jgi:3',5'-cyclic AMP phosphodiesterase CpdA